jgi:glutathione S-transferase
MPDKQNKPLLYSFRRCPYAIRARMALIEAKIDYELVEVSLKNKPQALLDLSAKGQVPVLLTLDAQVIDESFDIMLWALKQSDPHAWLPDDPSSRKAAYAWLKQNDELFKPLLDRCKYPDRYPKDPLSHSQQAARTILLDWENHLSSKAFFHGKTFGLADACLLPFVRQFAHIEHPDPIWGRFDCPHLQAWLDAGLASQSFRLAFYPKEID